MRPSIIVRALLSLVGMLGTLILIAPRASAEPVYDTWFQGGSGGYHFTIDQLGGSYLVGADLHELSTGLIYVPTFRAWLPSDFMAVYITPGNMWTHTAAKVKFCYRGAGDYGTGSAYDFSMFFAWAKTLPNGDWIGLEGSEDHLPQFVSRFTESNCAAVLLK